MTEVTVNETKAQRLFYIYILSFIPISGLVWAVTPA